MLYVQVNKPGIPVYYKVWHIDKGRLDFPKSEIPFVVEVQADCDELDHVIKLFTQDNGNCTIPTSARRGNYWYGDIAKTIVSAIK